MLILKSYRKVLCHKGKVEAPLAPAGRSGWKGRGVHLQEPNLGTSTAECF